MTSVEFFEYEIYRDNLKKKKRKEMNDYFF